MIVDSGKRHEFETGAVRDIQEGKGRCDLMPLKEISFLLPDDILEDIHDFIYEGNTAYLRWAVKHFIEKYWGEDETAYPSAFLDLAIHYEEGCKKYGERNWEKGIPLHCFIDSAIRHYLKCVRGDKDEHHDRAFLWNIFGAIWTLGNKHEMNDLPFAKSLINNGDEET